MASKQLWAWDSTNEVWIPLAVDANGRLKVDMSNINLDDLADVSVAAPADDDLFYYDDATSLWKSRKLVDADIPAAIARDTEVATAVSDHAGLATGVHGVGASTIESIAGSQAKVDAHNALVLSHLVHDNDNSFEGYGNEIVTGLPNSTDIGAPEPRVTKAPALTAVSDPLSNLDTSDWYGASGAYKQADADSDATHIEDDSESFPASLRNTVVKWASNAAGDADTGIGMIKTVDSDTLTIIKCSGVNFAASYYYWIKHSEWVIPVTGLYIVEYAALYLPAEADLAFQVYLCYYQGTSTPLLNAQVSLHSPVADYCQPGGSTITNFTADDHVFIGARHNGTSGVPALYTSDPSHIRLRIFLLKQTA